MQTTKDTTKVSLDFDQKLTPAQQIIDLLKTI